MACPLLQEKVWFEKNLYDEAERQYYEKLSKLHSSNVESTVKHAPIGKTQPSVKMTKNVINNRKWNSSPPEVVKPPTPPPTPVEDVEKPLKEVEVTIKEMEADVPMREVCVVPAPGANPTPNTEKRFKQKEAKEKRKERKRDLNKDKRVIKDDTKGSPNNPLKNSLAGEVAKVRQHIKTSLECMDGLETIAKNNNVELINRVNALERENSDLKKLLNELQGLIKKLDTRVKVLETQPPKVPSGAPVPAPAKSAPPPKEEEDDDVDLFGSESEEESEDAKRVKEARLAAYHEKKSKKPTLIAKSNIILDVKPWDDETDMKAMEQAVRKIEIDGLLWGASKLVPLAYGIHKLQISCVVEDEKVSVDLLQENIENISDYVQSVDIAAFNKV